MSKDYPIRKALIQEAWSFLNGESKKILSQMSLDKHSLVGIYASQKKGMEEWLKVYDSKSRPSLPYIYTVSLENALNILKHFNDYDWSKKVLYHSWSREYDDPKGMFDAGLLDEIPAPYEVYNNILYNIYITNLYYKTKKQNSQCKSQNFRTNFLFCKKRVLPFEKKIKK